MNAVGQRVASALLLAFMDLTGLAQTGIVERNANVRATASATGPRIVTLKSHSKVTIISPETKNGFYHVRTEDGRHGWIAKNLVRISAVQQSRKLVRRPMSLELERHLPGAAAARCAQDLASCPANGCSPADSSHGLANKLKRTLPTGTAATMLTFDDFASLQQQADNLVGEDSELTADDRAKLRDMAVANGHVSEGDVVSLAGYLVGTPHPNTGESVNCNLRGEQNNDYHIPMSNDPANSDFQGIVVEMIPQNRSDSWNLANLTQVANNQQLVMVTGALFYDNFHKVNGDPNNPVSGQPHRFSLFEIHPITQFVVCSKADNSCDPTQPADWVLLGGAQ